MRKRKQIVIAFLTGGGDIKALNATMNGGIEQGRKLGIKILGIRNGYKGLIGENTSLDDFSGVDIVDLTHADLEGIKYFGGSFLGSSRTNPSDDASIQKCIAVAETFGIDVLIPIGGDDTMKGAWSISKKSSISVVGVNKTMDNDLQNTFVCIGYPSTLETAINYASNFHTTLHTNKRDAVLYVFGRKAGWAPLATAAWTDSEDPDMFPHITIVPEMQEVTKEDIIERYDCLKRKHGYVLIAVSEGALIGNLGIEKKLESVDKDSYDNPDLKHLDVPSLVAELIRDHNGLTGADRESKVIYRRLDYLLRAGSPVECDRIIGDAAGRHAVDLAISKSFSRMVTIEKEGKNRPVYRNLSIGDIPLKSARGGRALYDFMYNEETMTPTKSFVDYAREFIDIVPGRYGPFRGELPKAKPVK